MSSDKYRRPFVDNVDGEQLSPRRNVRTGSGIIYRRQNHSPAKTSE